MGFRVLADVTLVLHFAFVLFVVLGGALVVRWPRLAWLHLPAAAWGAWVELAGWICPLTPLENHFRRLAGVGAYSGGFVERYLIPLIYPEALTRMDQFLLGTCVVAVNLLAYGLAWHNRRRKTR